ncbi:MAG: ABC transporter ATP-binding protein, partial [Muribaculaceae bacterium]|nr:ABC transporter ATP-binding protein [Muribaculaceae bacterium]
MAGVPAGEKSVDENCKYERTMSEFVKWLWRESCGVKRYVTANAVCGIVSVGCSLWFVWVTKHIVDMATHRSEGSWTVAVAMLACALALQLCASVAGKRSGVMATTRFSNNLRGRLFEHLMKAEWTGKERFH